MPGVPFDESRGVFSNDKGRIIKDGAVDRGLYTSGWIKRGPTGIIGTNKADSVETVGMLLEDIDKLDTGESKSGGAGCCEILDRRGVRHISFSDWKKIDAAEITRGQTAGKPRRNIPQSTKCWPCWTEVIYTDGVNSECNLPVLQSFVR